MVPVEATPAFFVWTVLPTLSGAFYFSNFLPKSDQCVDFKWSTGHLQSGVPWFSAELPRPVNTAGKPYIFGCAGGEVKFCTVSERVYKTCPKLSLERKREVWGLIKIPSFQYSLRNCQFGEDGNQVRGDVEGKAEGAHISFRVVSVGMRRICDMSLPKIQRNLMFFPDAYFTRIADHHRSLNYLAVREAIVKSVNDKLANSIKQGLNTSYECDSFFRTTR